MNVADENGIYKLSNGNIVNIWMIDTYTNGLGWGFCVHYFSVFFPLANSIILIYDVTDKESFKACEGFRHEIFQLCRNNGFNNVLLLGNKVDKINKREISFEEGKKFAEESGFTFMEISCSFNKNIMKAVEIAVALGEKCGTVNQTNNENQNNKKKKKRNCLNQ